MSEQSQVWLGRVKSIVTVVFIVIGAALARGVARDVVGAWLRPPSTSNLASQASLTRVASEVNQSLPMMVDRNTELMNVVGLEGVIVYNYRLVNTRVSEITAEDLTTAVRPRVVTSSCTTSSSRDTFLKRGVTMRFAYVDMDHIYVGSFDVAPSDCNF